jgi:Fe(3+) dicitrate transport protein
MVLASRGAQGSQDNRIGDAKALAFYVQDEIRAGHWIITPGLRYESIDLTRTDYARQPDGRTLDPTRVRKSALSEWMPGLGVTWLVNDDFNVFASAHKGFNPPGPGSDVDPEQSLNLEAGLRWGRDTLQTELVGFWNDYDNLVGTCTASSGGDCEVGDQFDGGKARVRGIEASLAYDFGRAGDWTVSMPVRLGYTWTDAEFRSNFESDFEEWGEVDAGDALPYLPEQALNVQVGVEGERWRVNLAGNYIDDMGTNAADTASRTESAFVLDLAAGYRLSEQAELFTRVENLTDETWIASRRPAGVRPGMPRQTYVGVRVKF